MGTVDANIWIAGFDATDRFHAESADLLSEADKRDVQLYVPSFVLVEVACVLARRFRDPAVGVRAASGIATRRVVRVVPLDDTLMSLAMDLGAQWFLRGADALYAATAQITGSTLVSWDQELIRRAGGMTPTDWLATLL